VQSDRTQIAMPPVCTLHYIPICVPVTFGFKESFEVQFRTATVFDITTAWLGSDDFDYSRSAKHVRRRCMSHVNKISEGEAWCIVELVSGPIQACLG
jgi:hypothetical protein